MRRKMPFYIFFSHRNLYLFALSKEIYFAAFLEREKNVLLLNDFPPSQISLLLAFPWNMPVGKCHCIIYFFLDFSFFLLPRICPPCPPNTLYKQVQKFFFTFSMKIGVLHACKICISMNCFFFCRKRNPMTLRYEHIPI